VSQFVACPKCGASPGHVPAPGATIRCEYCSAVYQVRQPASVLRAGRSTPHSLTPLLVLAVVGVLGVLVVLAVGVAAVVYLAARSPSEGEPAPEPKPAPIATSAAPAPSESPPVEEPPSQEVPMAEPGAHSTATFEFHGIKSSSGKSFYVLGFVTNTSPHAIDNPKVTVVLLDAQGKEVGSDDGYAEGDWLPPKGRAPIDVLVKDPPPYVKLRYEVVASEASYIPSEVSGLKIVSHEERKDSMGSDWECRGKVRNGGRQPAKFVKIQILAYRSNKLVAVDSAYADGDVLRPGAIARFSSSVLVDVDPDRFELTVSGRTAD
jgi:hypothetical protein